jgi:hypothetical protein
MAHHKVLQMPVLCCSILLFACGSTSPTAPKGPIGNFDLRSYLPADVKARAPADASAPEYKAQVDVGEPAAKVLIRWRVFKDGQSAYVISASFDVLEEAKGVELKTSVGEPINTGSRDAVVAAHPVLVTWSSPGITASKSGTLSGTIVATGEWRAN